MKTRDQKIVWLSLQLYKFYCVKHFLFSRIMVISNEHIVYFYLKNLLKYQDKPPTKGHEKVTSF